MKSFHNKINIDLKLIYIIISLFNLELAFCTDTNMQKEPIQFPQLSNSCRHFSSNLFQALTSEQIQENVVSSSLSAHIILSLLLHGADGTTREELKSGLHLIGADHIHENLKNLLASLNNVEKAELEMVNAIYINSDFTLLQNFMSTSKDIFNIFIEKINSKNNDESANQINSWVKVKTRGRISHIVNSGDIDEDTKVILINALYFRSAWSNSFEQVLTENKIFYTINKVEINVPTMYKSFNLPHGQIPSLNANFVKIKYLTEDFEMIIILPNERYGLHDLEKKFDWDFISKVPYTTKEIELSLPKFKIESTIDLKPTLKKLGINTIFEEKANFSLMAEKSLYVDQVLQKLYINVDEKGSEAAVATVAQMRSRRMILDTEDFIVDHPFMFVINHKPSSIPLFIGSIRKLEGILSNDLSKDEL